MDRDMLADLLGVRADHVTRLVSQGLPCKNVGGGRGNKTMFDAVRALAWMRERQQAEGPANGSVRDQYLAALRDRVVQDTQMRAGELVVIEEVVLAGQMIVKSWTAWLRGLPRRLVVKGIIPREQERPVAEVIHQLQVEISTWRPVKESAPKAQKAST